MSPNELKAIRQRLDLTQAALASKLGVTREAVARWETGERAISGPVALAIKSLKPKRRTKRSK